MAVQNTFNRAPRQSLTHNIATQAGVSADILPNSTKTAMINGMALETKSDQSLQSPSKPSPLAAPLQAPVRTRNSALAAMALRRTPVNAKMAINPIDRETLKRGILEATDPGKRAQASINFNAQLAANRFGFFSFGAEMDRIRNAGGARPWLVGQLTNSNMDFGANFATFDARLRRYRTLRNLTGDPIRGSAALAEIYGMYDADARKYLREMALTNRPFLHRYAQFWMNHFSVNFSMADVDLAEMGLQAFSYFSHLILPGVFGKFEDLVKNVSRFPAAMQQYSVHTSKKGAFPVEDWPREMMELHTVGADAGYTDVDIKSLARLWTGFRWSSQENEIPDQWGRTGGKFYFYFPDHDAGIKNFPFLGVTMAGGYSAQAAPAKLDQILTLLARHPKTADHLAHKLVYHFISDNLTDPAFLAAKDRIAAVFKNTQGDLIAVARALLTDSFALSTSSFKAPRPIEWIIGMIRAGGLVSQVGGASEEVILGKVINNYLPALNMPLHQAPDVRGFLMDNSRWVNDGNISTILDHALMLAPAIAAKISAADFYNNVVGELAKQSGNGSTTKILQFAQSDPVNAIVCAVMSSEILMPR